MAYHLHRKPHNTLILYQMVTLCQFKVQFTRDYTE